MAQKRFAKIGLFLLIWLIALIIGAPMLLNLPAVQNKVLSRISRDINATLHSDSIKWHWSPFPRLGIYQAYIEKESFSLAVQEARIYPSIKAVLMKKSFDLGTIELINPQFHWRGGQKTENKKITLPTATIRIKDGSFWTDVEKIPIFLNKDRTAITGIDSTIKTFNNTIIFNIDAKTRFSEQILANGSFKIDNKTYAIEVKSKDLYPAKIVNPFIENGIMLSDTPLSLQAFIQGKGTDEVTIRVKGGFPSFNVDIEDKKAEIKCGKADISFQKKGADTYVDIGKLQVIEPAFNLSGHIDREIRNTKNETTPDKPSQIPYWIIDLQGTDLDASPIRDTVLALFGDHKVARIVCDIVHDGKAKKARYTFSGYEADFEHVSPMTLFVDVETSTIKIPKTDLYVTKASGPIYIEDGKLFGKKLKGWLNTSYGKDCFILVGLGENNHDFKLDVDIDANIADLPQVLQELVKHEGFQQELRKFKNVSGKAKGRLVIGDSLKDMRVEVQVKEMTAKTKYDRLRVPVSIRGGQLHVLPESVEWQNILASAGPHMIYKSDGRVSWHDNVEFSLKDLQASLNGKALLLELTGKRNLHPDTKASWKINSDTAGPEAVAKILTLAEGPVRIKNGNFHGKAGKPEQWEYAFDIAAKGLKWATPYLPGPILTEQASALITQDNIQIHGSRSWFLSQPINLYGYFKHKNLNNWQGSIYLNGIVQEQVAGWIKQNRWVPQQYFPRIPCRLERFQVKWDDNTVGVNGTIIAGSESFTAPRVLLQLTRSPDKIDLKKAEFSSGRESGTITAAINPDKPENFQLKWQGTIGSKTITELLENKIFTGSITGDFILDGALAKEGKSFLSGSLNGSGIKRILAYDLTPFTIKNISMTGQENSFFINDMTVGFKNEAVVSKGNIDFEKDKMHVSLDIDSPSSSLAMIKNFENLLEKLVKVNHGKTDQDKLEETHAQFSISGKINVDASSFKIAREKTSPQDSDKPPFEFAPLEGEIIIQPDKLIKFDLTSGNLCGINVTGSIQHQGENTSSSFNLLTNPGHPPYFEKMLPCLGYSKSIASGPVFFEANVNKLNENISTGKTTLRSEKGVIHQLALLSKIFKVVNITDLFTESDIPDLGKKGLSYSSMEIITSIKENKLQVDKAVIKGEGLNLFARGSIDLKSSDSNLTILIAPLKTIDSLISTIPVIGRIIGGENATVLTIPVSVKGDLNDPQITILNPAAVGEGIVTIVADVLKFPFYIIDLIKPTTPEEQKK